MPTLGEDLEQTNPMPNHFLVRVMREPVVRPCPLGWAAASAWAPVPLSR